MDMCCCLTCAAYMCCFTPQYWCSKVDHNDAGCNDNLDVTTRQAGTGFAVVFIICLPATTHGGSDKRWGNCVSPLDGLYNWSYLLHSSEEYRSECNIAAKVNKYFRNTVITTVITANTQCRIVVTNRNHYRDGN